MNGTERMVKDMLEQRGFRVLRNGWPDFLCLRKHVKKQGIYFDGTPALTEVYGLMAVEVKSPKDALSETQREVHKALWAVRIPVFVVRPPLDGSTGFKTRHFLTGGEITAFSDSVTSAKVKAEALQAQINCLQSQLAEINTRMDAASSVIGDARAALEEAVTPSSHQVEYEEVRTWRLPDKASDEAAP
jgi:hypothetical protein